jgi:hypothetical protein
MTTGVGAVCTTVSAWLWHGETNSLVLWVADDCFPAGSVCEKVRGCSGREHFPPQTSCVLSGLWVSE